jgi:cobalt-precorrin 5A hydrolase
MATGDAGHAMGLDKRLDKTVIAAGVGCRRGASAPDIEAAIRAALASANITADALDVIATIEAKSAEAGIHAAAEILGVSVVIVPEPELATAGDRVETHSERVFAFAGVGSVAEAAALAAAGPSAKLIAPRVAMGAATCALAASPPAPGAAV